MSDSEKMPFSKADHTVVVSDIHLTTAEAVHPKDPLWKKYKQREFFIDEAFEKFLKNIQLKADSTPIELILAGDIFDFDGVVELPKRNRFIASWLERKRGLNTEERKSRYKVRLILADHFIFFRALAEFVRAGNRVVFIIGNHDLELHWPRVQRTITMFMRLNAEEKKRVRFNNWFYISNKDTLVEHGNQHDSHSNCQNPINPLVQGLRAPRIRLPFGCWANRLLMNGMGFFNPHSERTFIMTGPQYVVFLFTHILRREPFLIWNWFWGATVTLFMTLKDGTLPELKDPLKVEDQVDEIAEKANSTPRMVRLLKEVHAPPVIMDPIGVARELWLDRAFLIAFVLLACFQLVSFFNLIGRVSYWWVAIIFMMFLPFFIFYFRSFKSKIIVNVKYYERAVKLGSKITGVERVVFGHTHEFVHTNFDGIEYLNSGTWSPAFDDIGCTKPTCPKTFVWIRPDTEKAAQDQTKRIANVYSWENGEMTLLC